MTKEALKLHKLYVLKHKDILKYYVDYDFLCNKNGIVPSLEDFNFKMMDYYLYRSSIMVYNAYRKKRNRIKKGVEFLFSLEMNLYFVTLTFEKVQDFISINKVAKLLDKISYYYILNEDFGLLNGRKHFHVVIGCYYNHRELKRKITQIWGFGFTYVKNVNNSELDIKKLSKYINKISNHAIKNTTTRCKYSRYLKFINRG